jgi:hypothetical protein
MILYCLIIILLLLLYTNNEHFSYFNLNLNLNVPISHNNEACTYEKINYIGYNYELPQNIQTNIFTNRIKLKNIANYDYVNNIITTNLLDSSNCCLVQKEFNDGKFNYTYTPLKNDKCNINLYELDHNNLLRSMEEMKPRRPQNLKKTTLSAPIRSSFLIYSKNRLYNRLLFFCELD